MNQTEALELTEKLSKQLEERASRIEKYERYYEGKHNLRFATRKYREAFGALFREFAQNWCGVIVDSTVERMHVEGFRIPTEAKEREVEEAEEARLKEKEERAEEEAKAKEEAEAKAAQEQEQSREQELLTAFQGGKSTPPPPPPPPSPQEPPQQPEAPTPEEVAEPIPPMEVGDDEAWELWQRNNLDLYSDIAHETMLVTGHAYIIVGPREDDEDNECPLITVEHPLEVITQHAPGDVKKITAALKRWYDPDEGITYATLYTPDTIYKWQGSNETADGFRRVGPLKWVPRAGEASVPNPFEGIVPVVPLINRQKLNGHGRSELLDLIPIQDAVNKLTSDMLVAAEFAAFRQRILTGMEIPEDEHGNIIPDFDLKASINRLLVVKDEDVKVHEFGVTDLKNYVAGIEHLRDSMAAISRTPPQYLVGQVVNVSGEALKAAESGQVQKAKRRCRFAGEGWETAIRLAFQLKGDEERAEAYDAETIWGNPEILTESAMADSLAKWSALGIPKQALWERGGASQTEVKRWMQMKAAEPEEPQGMPAALSAMINASKGPAG